jgi:hypothetical protein
MYELELEHRNKSRTWHSVAVKTIRFLVVPALCIYRKLLHPCKGALKGQLHEIFDPRFFHQTIPPTPLGP